jgi:hypothetical protein
MGVSKKAISPEAPDSARFSPIAHDTRTIPSDFQPNPHETETKAHEFIAKLND